MAQDMGGVDLADITGKLRSRGCGSDEINALTTAGLPVSDKVRSSLAHSAHKDGWFKRIDWGEAVIQASIPSVGKGTHLAQTITAIQAWMTRT